MLTRNAVPLRSLPLPVIWLIAIASCVGIAERVGWAMIRRVPWATGEAPNVAIALAQGRGFSDAFFWGQGPTAHLLPIAPAIAGAAYWLFGIRSPAAEAMLCLWSIGVSLGSYLFFYAAFGCLGTPRWARLGMFVALLVIPIYTTNEVFEFRVWEGGLGLFIGSALLYVLLRADAGDPPRHLRLWRALLPALAFFINPVIGLAAYVSWCVHIWRHRWHPRHIIVATAETLLALALMIGPWSARNMIVMGQPILLRDNLGMELAVGNYPEAVNGKDRNTVFYDHLEQIQPYIHPKAQRALVMAGGEVNYAHLLGERAKAWIRTHPGDFLTLCRRHFGQMLLPGTWMFMTSHGVYMPIFRSVVVRALHILGILGLIFALIRRDGRFLYVLPFATIPLLLYIPFQPVIRYTWLLYPAMAFCAADLIGRIRLHLSRQAKDVGKEMVHIRDHEHTNIG